MRLRTKNCLRISIQRFRLAGVMVVLFLLALICPVGAQEANLALNKPITPHTNIQQGEPEHVVDGDPITVWYSWQGGFTEISFTVDLTFAAHLTSYRFLPRQLTTYRIETSIDGDEWVERSSGTIDYGQTSALEIDNPAPQHARYIRFTGSNNQNAFAGLAEFEAFGDAVTAVDLPQTGQAQCFDTAGVEITCAGTGQDGEIQAGVAWPEPRFIDNNDGTFTDNLTGLIWLKNANCYDQKTWDQALSYVSFIEDGFCGLSDNSQPGDWRLPNINELESLTNLQVQDLDAWLRGQGFSDVQPQWYWSSTTAVDDKGYALFVAMDDGRIDDDNKENPRYFWPVRSVAPGAVALPQTGQTECYNAAEEVIGCSDTGQDGEIRAGISWPEPRFTDNLDGTVTDNLTGLVWLKNATCTNVSMSLWQNALEFANGLSSGECGLSDGSQAGDWRLPNRKEMLSLLDRSRISPPLPDNHPFTDVLNSHYWTSSTWVNSSLPGRAWYVGFNSNDVYPKLKDQSAYAWPVHAALELAPFAGGDGSPEDPYQIATAQHLNAVRDYLDKHFILIADIDLTDEWEPIGTYVNWESTANEPFTGSLNGAGFSISGLFINRPFDLGQDGAGLFGLTEGATIENLNLANVDITGRTAGALIGWAFATTVKNVTTSGEVTALTRAGGLMGEVFENSQILDSSSSCQVTTTNGTNAGGLVGQMRRTLIERSFATGDVSSGMQDIAGGLVGEASLGSRIVDSYATGSVLGGDEVGGLVGYLNGSDIEGSWATGRVEGNRRVGGLVGYTFNVVLISESYASGVVEGFGDVGGLVGELWGNIDKSSATGDVIANNRAGGLVGISQSNSEITASHATGAVTGVAGPIGGLVGRSDGLISHSYATGAVTSTGSSVGGLVGDLYNTGARVDASYATGAVAGTSYVGGLVGSAYQSFIANSYASGAVSGDDEVGGLVGELSGLGGAVMVENCYAAGLVAAVSDVGGLIGNASAASISNSYYDRETSNQSDTGKGEPKTTAELQQAATFTGWDFTATWKMVEAATLPYLYWQKHFVFGAAQVWLVEKEGDIQAGHVVRPDPDAAQTRAQSTVTDENSAGIEGLLSRWMAVTRAGSSEVRAVAATDAEGESRTWFEVYNAQTETWEKVSTTLALDIDAFEAGSEIVIEEDDENGLQIRIETQVTRELHF